MTVAEYYDGGTWQTIASQVYTNDRITNDLGLYVEQSYFSNSSFNMTGNVATQALAANTWAKLTFSSTFGGVVTNNFNSITSQNLFSLTANRLTKLANNPNNNNWFKAMGSAVIASSSGFTHNISLQIVKNGILSSVLPYGFPSRVAQNAVQFGYQVDTNYFQLDPTDYIELYVLSTVATTITTSTLIINLQNIG